jgi:hypothetical protein
VTVLKAAAMMMALVLAYLALWLVATFVLPWVFVALAMPPMMMVALMGAAPWPTVPAVMLAVGQFALYQQTRHSPY